MAQQVWRPLFGVIEKRWEARFGKDQIDKLRGSLSALVSQIDVELPEYLPVLGYGFCTEILTQKRTDPGCWGKRTAGAPFQGAARLHARLRARVRSVSPDVRQCFASAG